MSDPTNESLLSAYLDGELTDEERVTVEAELESSESLRRELQELKQISGLVQSLEPKPLPADFAAEVMYLAERESLIPSTTTESAFDSSRRDSARLWVGGLVSTVAIVLVMATVWRSPFQEEAADVAKMEAPAAATRNFAGPEESADIAVPDSANEGMGASSVSRTADVPTESTPSTNATAHESVVEKTDNGLLIKKQSLNNAKVGDIVEALDTSKEQLAVVRLTVVDLKQGMEAFQVLLQSNEIEDSKNDDGKDATSNNGLTAVFVEADAEMLTAALEQLQQSGGVQEIQLREPIEVASLGPEIRNRIHSASLGQISKKLPSVTTHHATRSATKKTAEIAGVSPDEKKEAEKRDKKNSPGGPKKDANSKSQSDSFVKKASPSKPASSPSQRLRQFAIPLSDEVLASNGRQQRTRMSSRRINVPSKNLKRESKAIPADKSKPARRVKVVFVLVAEDATPASPNADAKKTDGAA